LLSIPYFANRKACPLTWKPEEIFSTNIVKPATVKKGNGKTYAAKVLNHPPKNLTCKESKKELTKNG
jgi:hypothetical protein